MTIDLIKRSEIYFSQSLKVLIPFALFSLAFKETFVFILAPFLINYLVFLKLKSRKRIYSLILSVISGTFLYLLQLEFLETLNWSCIFSHDENKWGEFSLTQLLNTFIAYEFFPHVGVFLRHALNIK